MMKMKTKALLFLLPLLALASTARAGTVCEARWTDPARPDRAIPVRIHMPDGTGRVPVVLFSHGLGGSLDSGGQWVEAWTKAGIAAINLQHPGSDSGIIGGGHFIDGMSAAQLLARVADVHFVIDELGRRPREGACDLTRIDRAHIGMSGHSFGAYTTLAIAGQHYPLGQGQALADPRVKAAIAFSPAPPFRGSDEAAFGDIRMPVMSVTGTADFAPVTPGIQAADRQRPWRAMAPGGKYLLVLDGATHMDFNGQDTPRWRSGDPDPRIAALTAEATTDFWRWTLFGDEKAHRALDAMRARLRSGDLLESR